LKQKQFRGEQNLPEYFFTCPNMTDLFGNFTVFGPAAVLELKGVLQKKNLYQKFQPKLTN